MAEVVIKETECLICLWTNTKEIPGNKLDDDGNGYVDDVYGWNFIGKTKSDNLEKTRFIGSEEKRYDAMKRSERKKDAGYEEYKTIAKELKKEAKKMLKSLEKTSLK